MGLYFGEIILQAVIFNREFRSTGVVSRGKPLRESSFLAAINEEGLRSNMIS